MAKHMLKKKWFWISILIIIIAIAVCSNDSNENAENEEEVEEQNNEEHTQPSMDELDPDDPMTEAIPDEEEDFNETNSVMPEHVGNELSCQHYHADTGRANTS